MPTEQRIIASKPKIGSRPTAGAAVAEPEPEVAPKSKKKLMIIVVVALLVAGGGGYWFLLGPGAGSSEATESEPAKKPGEVMTVDPVNLNLAGGHYLRLGLGLQMTADAGSGHGKIDSARALDIAIALFSGRTVEEVSSAESREALKVELLHQLDEAYHGEVMGVYFTDYVTQ